MTMLADFYYVVDMATQNTLEPFVMPKDEIPDKGRNVGVARR